MAGPPRYRFRPGKRLTARPYVNLIVPEDR